MIVKKKITPAIDLPENVECVHYRWFDSILIRECPKLIQLIEDSIENHDLKAFTYLQFVFNNFYYKEHVKFVCLPTYVTVYYKDRPGHPCQHLLCEGEELFNMINSVEYECDTSYFEK